MMNILKNILVGSILFSLSACDFLDLEPLDSYTEKNVFSDESMVEAYVTRNYNILRDGFSKTAMYLLTDEAYCNFNWGKVWNIYRGEMTPDQYGDFNIWDTNYKNIRACNIFFNNIDKIPGEESFRNLLIGEMTFFRAFYYMELINRYGGVPLITKTFELNDSDLKIQRNSYEECCDFIVNEFEKAAQLLPLKHTGPDFGRVTKGAALAMKSRLLLYAASPLWNPNNDVSKWRKAADAAKAIIDLGVYELDSDYKSLFLNSKSKEIIFQRLFTPDYPNGLNFDWTNSPNGFGGYSAINIVQSMVDSYEMEDGTLPDPSVYETATENPWKGRDPRFYASIVCDNQEFRGRPIEFWINEDGKTGGIDSKFGYESWNSSKSRYTIRKFLDESLRVWNIDKGSQPWIFCRLGEIYLNYAEAMLRCGNEVECRKYINMIRARARGGKQGILPDVTESGEALFERLVRERKIELAFEEFRFFDVRRWKIAEETDNKDAEGIEIIKKADETKSYKVVFLDKHRFIAPNHYLFPIPNYEIRKNNLLEQNPGYTKIN